MPKFTTPIEFLSFYTDIHVKQTYCKFKMFPADLGYESYEIKLIDYLFKLIQTNDMNSKAFLELRLIENIIVDDLDSTLYDSTTNVCIKAIKYLIDTTDEPVVFFYYGYYRFLVDILIKKMNDPNFIAHELMKMKKGENSKFLPRLKNSKMEFNEFLNMFHAKISEYVSNLEQMEGYLKIMNYCSELVLNNVCSEKTINELKEMAQNLINQE